MLRGKFFVGYIDLPDDENISEDKQSSENKYFTDDGCTNYYESISDDECINSLRSYITNKKLKCYKKKD